MSAQCVSVSRRSYVNDIVTVDCTVIGFDAQFYELDEQAGSQQLAISVLTPPASLTSSVTLQVTAQSGNASGEMHIDCNRIF